MTHSVDQTIQQIILPSLPPVGILLLLLYQSGGSPWLLLGSDIGWKRMKLPWRGLNLDIVGLRAGRELMKAIGQCTQVVMISCLHLGLEAAQPLGRFAWTQPNAKEPAESTLRIMRRKSTSYDQNPG